MKKSTKNELTKKDKLNSKKTIKHNNKNTCNDSNSDKKNKTSQYLITTDISDNVSMQFGDGLLWDTIKHDAIEMWSNNKNATITEVVNKVLIKALDNYFLYSLAYLRNRTPKDIIFLDHPVEATTLEYNIKKEQGSIVIKFENLILIKFTKKVLEFIKLSEYNAKYIWNSYKSGIWANELMKPLKNKVVTFLPTKDGKKVTGNENKTYQFIKIPQRDQIKYEQVFTEYQSEYAKNDQCNLEEKTTDKKYLDMLKDKLEGRQEQSQSTNYSNNDNTKMLKKGFENKLDMMKNKKEKETKTPPPSIKLGKNIILTFDNARPVFDYFRWAAYMTTIRKIEEGKGSGKKIPLSKLYQAMSEDDRIKEVFDLERYFLHAINFIAGNALNTKLLLMGNPVDCSLSDDDDDDEDLDDNDVNNGNDTFKITFKNDIAAISIQFKEASDIYLSTAWNEFRKGIWIKELLDSMKGKVMTFLPSRAGEQVKRKNNNDIVIIKPYELLCIPAGNQQMYDMAMVEFSFKYKHKILTDEDTKKYTLDKNYLDILQKNLPAPFLSVVLESVATNFVLGINFIKNFNPFKPKTSTLNGSEQTDEPVKKSKIKNTSEESDEEDSESDEDSKDKENKQNLIENGTSSKILNAIFTNNDKKKNENNNKISSLHYESILMRRDKTSESSCCSALYSKVKKSSLYSFVTSSNSQHRQELEADENEMNSENISDSEDSDDSNNFRETP